MTGAIREVFQHVMRGSGRMGWMVGHMDIASMGLQVVLDDARENLARNPRHEQTQRAVANLAKAVSLIRETCDELETMGSGESV